MHLGRIPLDPLGPAPRYGSAPLDAFPEWLFGCRDIRQPAAEVATIATASSSKQAPGAGGGSGLAGRRELLPTHEALLVTLALMIDALRADHADAIGSHGL